MDHPFQALVAHSFKSGPAAQANQLINDVRQEVKAEHGSAMNYEVVLTDRSWDYVREVLAPRLALFMSSKKLDPRRCRSLFLSVFVDQTLFFISAQAFYEHYMAVEELSEEQFQAQAHVWQQSGRPVVLN